MVFLAPHNDDETLFGAYSILRHRPQVIVVLRSFVEATWDPPGPTYEVRELETFAACEILGVSVAQWEFRDDAPDWPVVEQSLRSLRDTHAFAPWPEPGGHAHHNEIAAIARRVFPKVTWYTTYTHARGRTLGERVEPEPGWPEIKRRALACYPSQAGHPRTAGGFRWPIDEYLAYD